ncbi:MAG: type III pantothenate kinase [Coriobacteriales bacterium]|jgi:type III pantothenate kinase|nr:type III pantothenate kinase [Coriobacteriales bacterium]
MALANTYIEDSIILLTVDVGNTTTRLGLYAAAELQAVWECATRDSLTSDEARLLLAGFLRNQNLISASFSPDDGIISCVVPSLTNVWAQALQVELGRRPLVVGPGLKTGLELRYNDPAEIGPDRIADVVAARDAYGFPLLVVDLGTSTNIAVIDEDGAFAGGLIAPGLALSAQALSRAAARLPTIEIVRPRSVIGKSTRDAMQAGFVLGEAARIDGLIEMIWEELGYRTPVVMTGSDAEALVRLSSHDALVDETLTLRGLWLLHSYNRPRR